MCQNQQIGKWKTLKLMKMVSVSVHLNHQICFFSSSETVSSASYLSFFERRKTTEHANLYAKKWSHRKLKLLEKFFELEKQRIVNEVMKDENKTTPKIRQK